MARSGAPGPLTIADFKPETVRGAAGFVRVAQTHAGQWWFLDARAHAFFSRGVNGVGRGYGRRADGGVALANAVDDSAEPGSSSLIEQLRSWHVDTLGAWSSPDLDGGGLHETVLLEFRKLAPETAIRLGGAMLPDVFNPQWKEACELLAAERCGPRCEQAGLIGYFTDDELGWAQPHAEALFAQTKVESANAPRIERPSLLQICLSLEPAFPAYHAAWEFALAPYGGDLATLARAWDAPIPNKEALRQLTLTDTPVLTDGYLRDNERFSREFARSYFTTCAQAIRRYDPHHLVLGCRFGGPPGRAVLAECVYPQVDVLSANDYRDVLADRIAAYAEPTGMPVLLSEFSWASEYFTKLRKAREPRGLTAIERMLSKGRAALEAAFMQPALVGYAWHSWMDRPGDQPPFGFGLVHIDEREAREHTELLSDLNVRAPGLHRASVP